MIHFLEAKSDYLTLGEYLRFWGRDIASRFTVENYEDLPRWKSAPAGTYVFADLDQLTARGARVAGELEQQIANAAVPVRMLNSPRNTLKRFELLQELYRRGLNSFRAVRAAESWRDLRYPVFVREERAHNGALTPLLRTQAEVEAGLGSAIARGRSLSDLLVVEFCDTADRDGFYRKFAAFVVGSEIIPRNIACGRNWMMKIAGTEHAEAAVYEELAFVRDNPHAVELRRIFAIAGVQYGRIDYSVKDGRVQTWEINLNPTTGLGLHGRSSNVAPRLQTIRMEAKEIFYERLRRAWEAVDAGGETVDSIPIRFTREALRGTRRIAHCRRHSEWRRAVRRRLSALRPAAVRIGEALSPVLVRLARRRA